MDGIGRMKFFWILVALNTCMLFVVIRADNSLVPSQPPEPSCSSLHDGPPPPHCSGHVDQKHRYPLFQRVRFRIRLTMLHLAHCLYTCEDMCKRAYPIQTYLGCMITCLPIKCSRRRL